MKAFVGAAAWVVVDKWGSRVASMASIAILARLLSPADFGTAAIVIAVVAVLQIVVDGGVSIALIRAPELTPKLLATGFWLNMVLGLILGLALFACAPLFALAYGNDELTPLLQLLALKFPVAAFASVPSALMQRNGNFRGMSLRRVIGNLAGAAVGVTAAACGAGALALILQSLASSLVATTILFAAARYLPSCRPGAKELRQLSTFGIFVTGSSLVTALGNQGMPLVFGFFMDAAMLGLFSISLQLTTLAVDTVGNVAGVVALPRLANQGSRNAQRSEYLEMYGLTSLFSYASLATLAATAPHALALIYGDRYTGATMFVVLLAIGAALTANQAIQRSLLQAANRPGLEAGINAASTGTLVLLALIFVAIAPELSALAFVIRGVVTYCALMLATRSATSIPAAALMRIDAKHAVPALAIAAFVFLMMPHLNNETLAEDFLIVVGTGALMIAIELLLFQRRTLSTIVLRFARRRRRRRRPQ